jgi:hypothetical protein
MIDFDGHAPSCETKASANCNPFEHTPVLKVASTRQLITLGRCLALIVHLEIFGHQRHLAWI